MVNHTTNHSLEQYLLATTLQANLVSNNMAGRPLATTWQSSR
jgi:hypothetical protein